ncbi:phage tail tube protein [Corynebacterium sp. TAE3-ERU16]|uniref:phage tail tube protein n=1 Tax=Corynebacterium sp. TAE3-ERU16 TaxID=2849493 RepID=UPI001C484DA1|nr:hypothetical protein [Corynebacterium sp. TAE3-ERU16]MBV7292375.1 hypothetical protein [Corynebacterium sp. TAE3-ERU16]
MAVAVPPGSCELNKALARDWALQVKKPGADDSEWIFARGLNKISVNVETSAVDSTDMESAGWESQVKTSRKLTINIGGAYARVGDATDLEPSQKLIRDTGMELGAGGNVDVRVWRTDGTDEGWEATCTNVFTDDSGEVNGLRSWSAALQSSCAPNRIKPVQEGKDKEASVAADAA